MEKITSISSFFFVFWILKIIIVSYLDNRNIKTIFKHRDEVPKDFKDSITLAEHQKAADYTKAKAKFSKYSRFFDNAFLAFLLPIGGASFLLLVVDSFGLSPIWAGLLFFFILGLVQSAFSIPFSYYHHFVLEQKFGFNKMTRKMFVVDLFKQLLLSVILVGSLLAMILGIMQKTTNWWFYAWIATFSFQLLTLLIYPRFIAPLFNKFTPLDNHEYLQEINHLISKTEFPAKELFVMDASIRSSHGNAYFTGFGKHKRIVFFDTLLKTLNPKEVQAVLAHEIGHYKHKHILKSLIKIFLLSGVLFYALAWLQTQPAFYFGHFIHQNSNHATLFLFFTLLPIYTFCLTPLSAYFSRKNEYQADNYAKKYADSEELISALTKLYKDNASPLIVDQFYADFYYSHPPAIQRIKNLRAD